MSMTDAQIEELLTNLATIASALNEVISQQALAQVSNAAKPVDITPISSDVMTALSQKTMIEHWKLQFGAETVNGWLQEIDPETTTVL